MNPNVGMAAINSMGGTMAGAPMPMMNNGTPGPQAAAAAAARQQQINESQRGILNTYIYEYFIRYGMHDCARSLLNSDQPMNVHRDGGNRRRDENGNVINGVDDPMDTDSKENGDTKMPEDLPPPKLPMPASDTSFLYEWFCLFWDIYNARQQKGQNPIVTQYVAHTQQQSRLKHSQQQQEMLRQMRPDMAQQFQQAQQAQLLRGVGNGNMNMAMKPGSNLARTAMANNQTPQMQMLQQQGNKNPMQAGGMDPNRDRPGSPAGGDGAPSPKRARLEGAQFNPNQPGAMMANGRPAPGMQGMQGAGNSAAAHQLLAAHGINPSSLNPQQLQQFVQMAPPAQAKSIAIYSQTLQQHQSTQMGGNKQMPNAGPHNQGSPMMGGQPELYYGTGDLAAAAGMRPGANPPNQAGAGNNHALQDYQMQLMLLEQQNKKRLMMARQEQDSLPGGPGPGQPGGPGNPPGANVQFPDTSPQAMRTGASPNPTDQMKRGTPQMNNAGVPSPMPEGANSRGSPNPGMNFMGNMDGNMAPPFMQAQAGMNGMRPPSSHPGQPFNGLNQQQMMAARQQGGNPQQWQGQPGQGPQGPNGQVPNNQGAPRAMPPPSAPAAAAANANNRTTASPQQPAAAPPTPNQGSKPAPKKKESKAAKDKRTAAQKKAANNAAATPAGDNAGEAEAPTPATPMTPSNPGNFKPGQNGAGAPGQPPAGAAAPVSAPAPAAGPVPPPTANDPTQNGVGMDFSNPMPMDFGGMDMGASMGGPGDVLSEFDFDSFLHDGDNGGGNDFDFGAPFPTMDGNEIGAE